MTEATWTRSDHWVGTPIEDSFVLMDIESGEYLTLNSSASDIWTALDRPIDVAGIVDLLVEKYAVAPDDCRPTVDGMLADFAARGLVRASA